VKRSLDSGQECSQVQQAQGSLVQSLHWGQGCGEYDLIRLQLLPELPSVTRLRTMARCSHRYFQVRGANAVLPLLSGCGVSSCIEQLDDLCSSWIEGQSAPATVCPAKAAPHFRRICYAVICSPW
jgi:hypothetical protein